MAKRNLKVDCLSVSSIQQLQKYLESYQKSLTGKCEMLAKRLADEGVEIAQMQVTSLDAVFTGDLKQSIHSEYVSAEKGGVVFAVVADSEHAIYVEMGTGIVGARSPYPGKLPAVYAQGKTIRQLADGRYGWFYQDKDGNWWFTEGMPSRPFLYNTSMELYRIVDKVAKEVFGG